MFRYWKKLNHFSKATLVSLPLSILSLTVLITCSGDISLPEWYLELIIAPTFLSNTLSAATYVGRVFDPTPKKERLFTVIGGIIAVAAGFYMAVTEALPVFKEIHKIGHFIYEAFKTVVSAFHTMSNGAGLGNRFGLCVDKENRRPTSEKVAIGTGITLGLIAAVALVALKVTASVAITGALSFASGGILPIIGAAIFIYSFTSSQASCADYFIKAVNFLRSKISNPNPKLTTVVNEKPTEYKYSFYGVCTALLIGAAVITGLVLAHQVVGVLAALALFTACIGVIGGLFSRIGRTKDNINNAIKILDKKSSENPVANEKRDPTLTFAPGLRLSPELAAENTAPSAPPSSPVASRTSNITIDTKLSHQAPRLVMQSRRPIESIKPVQFAESVNPKILSRPRSYSSPQLFQRAPSYRANIPRLEKPAMPVPAF